MVLANKLYGIKDSANMQLISLKTGRVILDVPQPNSIEQAWSNTGITEAKNHGTRAITWDGQKECTITASIEVMNSELMALMSKAKLVKEAIDGRVRKEFKVTEENQVLNLTDLGNVVAVTDVFVVNSDKTKKKDITEESVFDDGAKTVTLGGAVVGDTVIVYGKANEVKTHFTIKDKDEVTEDYMLVFDTLAKTQESGEEDYFQYQFFKVHINFEYTLSHDTENVASIDLKLEAMKDDNGNMCTYVNLFDEDDSDVPVVEPTKVYVGGIADGDKAGLTVNQTLLDGLTKVESVSKNIAVKAAGCAINGKNVIIVADKEIEASIDATSLDITSDYTLTSQVFDGVTYYIAYETTSSPNGNFDIDMTIKVK